MSKETQITFECDRGQTMAEYGVVLAVITLAIVATFAALSGAIEAAIGATAGLLGLVV